MGLIDFILDMFVDYDSTSSQEDSKKEKATDDAIEYYNSYIGNLVDEAKYDLAKQANSCRNYYGEWPKVKTTYYSKSYVDVPDCPSDAIDLSNIYYNNYSDLIDRLKLCNVYYSLYGYNKNGLADIAHDEQAIEEFESKMHNSY